jgi:hypothetical protein
MKVQLEEMAKRRELQEIAEKEFEELSVHFNDWNFDIFSAFDVTPCPLVKVGFVCLDAFSHSIELNREKVCVT